MSDPKDFTNRPFVAGSLRGIRHWRFPTSSIVGAACAEQDENGNLIYTEINSVLYAASREMQWTAGENTSTCLGSCPCPDCVGLIPSDHRVAGVDCTCGFYAFFSEQYSEFAYPSSEWISIRGIIEGYGTVTVGWKGFRAEKARILAFISEPVRVLPWPTELHEIYPDVPVYRELQDALKDFPLSKPPEGIQKPENEWGLELIRIAFTPLTVNSGDTVTFPGVGGYTTY